MYFATYQHYFYYALFWGLFILAAVQIIYPEQITNPYYYWGGYLLILLAYVFMKYNYGKDRYLPQNDTMVLTNPATFIPKSSLLKHESKSGFSLFMKFYLTNFDYNPLSRILNAPGLFVIDYDGVSGNINITINTKLQEGKSKRTESNNNFAYYDNVLVIKNVPLQKMNYLSMICNQDKCYVFFNNQKYVFNIDFYPSPYYGGIYVGQDNGVSGTVHRLIFSPYASSLNDVPKINRMLHNESKLLLNVIPYL